MEEQMNKIRHADVNIDGAYVGTYARVEGLGPERALLLAVLEDAINCFRKYSTARNRAGKNCFNEVEHWIMQRQEESICGFENICEALGLDPGYVRDGLLQWKSQTVDNPGLPHYRQFRRRAA